MADFKKSVSLMSNAAEAAETEIDNTEYTEEEAKSVIKANEETFIQGLIDAVGFGNTETQRIEIVRGGRLFFAFRIHPLNADDYNRCREKHMQHTLALLCFLPLVFAGCAAAFFCRSRSWVCCFGSAVSGF